MPTSMSSMTLRIVTGLLLLVLLAIALIFGGKVLLGVLIVVCSLALCEFYSLFWERGQLTGGRILSLLLGAGMLILAWMFPDAVGQTAPAAILVLFCSFLASWGFGRQVRFYDTALLATGLCYIPLLLAPVLGMSMREQLFLVGITIISDTAAYFAGVRFGRHKIWPSVSPKKSLEGCAAGLLGSLLWAIICGSIWGTASPAPFAFAGMVLGVVSQLGDFFESAVKRFCNVKDSGSLLPGHGGMLDRIDSLLFVVPVYSFFTVFIPLFG